MLQYSTYAVISRRLRFDPLEERRQKETARRGDGLICRPPANSVWSTRCCASRSAAHIATSSPRPRRCAMRWCATDQLCAIPPDQLHPSSATPRSPASVSGPKPPAERPGPAARPDLPRCRGKPSIPSLRPAPRRGGCRLPAAARIRWPCSQALVEVIGARPALIGRRCAPCTSTMVSIRALATQARQCCGDLSRSVCPLSVARAGYAPRGASVETVARRGAYAAVATRAAP